MWRGGYLAPAKGRDRVGAAVVCAAMACAQSKIRGHH